jgi:hypothetical protein
LLVPVIIDQLPLFSTGTAMLGSSILRSTSPHGSPAAATGIDRLRETDTSFQIAWPGSYRLDGSAFLYTDRHSRRVLTIL